MAAAQAGPLPAVEAQHLTMEFTGQLALADVSVRFEAGHVHCLAGQNGSGKSTLIKILAGYHTPSPGGRVLVDGVEMPLGSPAASRRAGLRFVHQDLALIDDCTVWENVALTAGYQDQRLGMIRIAQERERVRRLLDRFGLAQLDGDALVRELSPVERSSVAIARALDDADGEIRLLVLDEPTATLPVAQVDKLLAMVEAARDRGIAILYVTHRLDEIFRLASTVTVLRDGRNIATVPAREIDKAQLITLLTGREAEAESERPETSRPGAGAKDATADSRSSVALRIEGVRSARLAGVSLEVGRGEILGLAGPFGSGREEIPYVLTGARPGEFSSFEVDGEEVARVSPRRSQELGVALVPGNRQTGSAVWEMSMRENVFLPHRGQVSRTIQRSAEQARLGEWMSDLRIVPPLPERLFSQFSGGNQQKILLAKWLNLGPKVVVLDEPTAGVDVGAREVIYDIIRGVAATGVSFVVSSSDNSDLLALCSRVLVFNRGSVQAELSGELITEAGILGAMAAAPSGSAVEHPAGRAEGND